MTNSQFLHWMADRLTEVYGEDKNTDFVQKLRSIAQRVCEDEKQHEIVRGMLVGYSQFLGQELFKTTDDEVFERIFEEKQKVDRLYYKGKL